MTEFVMDKLDAMDVIGVSDMMNVSCVLDVMHGVMTWM